MKRQAVLIVALAVFVSMSLSAISPASGVKTSKGLLTEEELAMAEAVGGGDYAMQVDLTLSYDPSLNCIVDDLGRGLWRPAGSEADHNAAQWIADEMENIGLQDVAMEPFPVHAFTVYEQAYVQVVSPTPGERILGAVPSGIPGTVQNPNADPDGGIAREIVYVGLGTIRDYVGKDVTDKIVLVDVLVDEMYWCNFPHMQATLEGAAGIIIHWLDYQQGPGYVYTADSESIIDGIPMITVSNLDFAVLKQLALSDPTATVKMYANCDVDLDGYSYNVVGYIPGKNYGSPEDVRIIHGAIYDKHWYGFNHHVSDVAAMMQSAKALIDSGYEPSCTLVYVAIGAEEYGWSDTLNAWAIGSHFHAHYDHPDWGGTTRAHVEFGGSLKYDYTVDLGGNPGTYPWRVSVISVINEFFSTHAPWSSYYVPASTYVGGLPNTWIDSWNYGTSGMETMEVAATGSHLYDGMYHCQNDTGIVDEESLAMTAIAGGINTIRLDRAPLAPYDFGQWADFIKGTIDQKAWIKAGIPLAQVNAELEDMTDLGTQVWNLIKNTKTSENADAINALMMQATKEIFSKLIINGGWGDESMLRHEHYQVDTTQLMAAIQGLEKGKIDAMWNLFDVYCGYYAWNIDYEVYYHFIIECTDPSYPGLMWGDQGREAHFTDVYQEFWSLFDKMKTGNSDYSPEIASLTEKYDVALGNLEDSVDILTTTLMNVNDLLMEVQGLLV